MCNFWDVALKNTQLQNFFKIIIFVPFSLGVTPEQDQDLAIVPPSFESMVRFSEECNVKNLSKYTW